MTENTPSDAMVEAMADYSEQALAERCIDFLEERATAWMDDTGVQRMFNAIASVFEGLAPQSIMDRFREQLGIIGRQCHVEGALRVWEEIAAQQRMLGKPLPPASWVNDDDAPSMDALSTTLAERDAEIAMLREELVQKDKTLRKWTAALVTIETLPVVWSMQADENMDRLRNIARAALEGKAKP